MGGADNPVGAKGAILKDRRAVAVGADILATQENPAAQTAFVN